MTGTSKGFQLYDKHAAELFQQFKGIDKSNRILHPPKLPINPKEGITGVLLKLDHLRLSMIELAELISRYLEDHRFAREFDGEKEIFDRILSHFAKLISWPGHDNVFLIRYRGITEGFSSEEQNDFVIQFGNLDVDLGVIPTLCKRTGESPEEMTRRLRNAFAAFAQAGVSVLYIHFKEEIASGNKNLRTALQFLSYYCKTLKVQASSDNIIISEDNSKEVFPMIYNINNQPDPNVTLSSILSYADPDQVQMLMMKVGAWMQQCSTTGEACNFMSSYDAIFSLKNAPVRLFRPVLEINNPRWLITDRRKNVILKDMARIVRIVYENCGGFTLDAIRSLESVYGDDTVYGNDFDSVDAMTVGSRIADADKLLKSRKTEGNQELEKEVVVNVAKRLSQVHEEVFTDLIVPKKDDEDQTRPGPPAILAGLENEKLKSMVDFYKRRLMARKKVKLIVENKPIVFNQKDYASLSRDFNIPDKDVKKVIQAVKECFSHNGRFERKIFEKHSFLFIKYDSIFEFFWHYIKAVKLSRAERVGFINALQLLTRKMKNKNNAVRMLLSDVFRKPEIINFSDRNAAMFVNLLLRTYSKEFNMDIELTPEEVLNVEKGIDQSVMIYIRELIESHQELFFEKMQNIQKELKNALSGKKDAISLHYLLSLERELQTFFALAGGSTANAILKIAMSEYGDPGADVYHLRKSRENMTSLLQRLRMLARGLGRTGEEEDVSFLIMLSEKKPEFEALGENLEALTRQIVEQAKASIKRIYKKGETG